MSIDHRRPEPGLTHSEYFTASYEQVRELGQQLRANGRDRWLGNLSTRLDCLRCPVRVVNGFIESVIQAGPSLALEAAVLSGALLVLFAGSSERGRLTPFGRATENVRGFSIMQYESDCTYCLQITGEIPYATGGLVGQPETENNVPLFNMAEVNKAALGLGEVPPEPPKPHTEAPRRLRVRRKDDNR